MASRIDREQVRYGLGYIAGKYQLGDGAEDRMTTMDLTAFTIARLDEDETAAAAASDGPWAAWRGRPGLGLPHLEYGVALPGQEAGSLASIATATWMDAEHVARHDPARVLREVAAMRAMVALHQSRAVDRWQICAHCRPVDPEYPDDLTSEPWPCRTLRLLAAIWSDHGDYPGAAVAP